jgi:hypothetical protein
MNLSGYLFFLHYALMERQRFGSSSMHGEYLILHIFKFVPHDIKMKIFSLHLLKYHKNEAEHNIPGIVRQYLRAIN